jgi:hypothetical protein
MGRSLAAPASVEKDSALSGGKGKQKEERVWKGIARVPFGYQVSCPVMWGYTGLITADVGLGSQVEVVVPSTAGTSSSLPTELDELIQAQAGFQLVRGLNLADLLVPHFMNDYIRNG